MRGRTFRAILNGYTSPEDDGAEDALLLTERTTNDWWQDRSVWRALQNDFPEYPVFIKDDGSALC